MANPQKENGYTMIANEIMEALARTRIAGVERQIVDVILRKTYGWSKTVDEISFSQFSELTGLNRPTVAKAIKKLLAKMVIGITNNGNSDTNSYCFIKDYTKWKGLPKKVTVTNNGNRGVTNNGKEVLPIMVNTKETLTKETIQKKVHPKKSNNIWEERFEKIWLRYPKRDKKKEFLL